MNKQDREAIGRRLRAVRERARISTAEAASAALVQPLAVEKWERGTSLPSLIEFRALLPVYGVMACEILFEHNPLTLTVEEAGELKRAAQTLNPRLRGKVDFLLAMMGQGTEPVWKRAA